MSQFEVIKINPNTWSIEDGFVRFFLLKGEEKALLIDSGFDIENVRKLAQRILKGPAGKASWDEVEDWAAVFYSAADIEECSGQEYPLELLNTHADGDHCLGNREFDWFYLHEGDREHYRRQFGEAGRIEPVNDGDRIDLGDRPLRIIFIPGHTMGSIAILDEKNRILFSGDSVQNGSIFMFGSHRSLEDYPASLLKLQEEEDQFDTICASHASLFLEPDHIGECFDACESVLHGEVSPEKQEVHGSLVSAYDCGVCTFLIDPDRVFEAAPED